MDTRRLTRTMKDEVRVATTVMLDQVFRERCKAFEDVGLEPYFEFSTTNVDEVASAKQQPTNEKARALIISCWKLSSLSAKPHDSLSNIEPSSTSNRQTSDVSKSSAI